MSKAIFFHLRKQIKAAMPNEFGAGKNLQPADGFNYDGKMTFAWGDLTELVAKLQAVLGDAYVVTSNQSTREVRIVRASEMR